MGDGWGGGIIPGAALTYRDERRAILAALSEAEFLRSATSAKLLDREQGTPQSGWWLDDHWYASLDRDLSGELWRLVLAAVKAELKRRWEINRITVRKAETTKG